MERRADEEKLIRQYLLGELPEEDKARLEERFWTDDAYFEQVQAAEQDLIEEYVRGELSETERAPFERQFLASPEGRREVEFARVWQRNVAAAPAAEAADTRAARPEPVSWWQALAALLRQQSYPIKFSWAAAALMALIAGAWLLVEATGWQRQLGRTQAELQRTKREYGKLQEQMAGETARAGALDKQLQNQRQEIARLEQELAKPPSVLDLRLTAERDVLAGSLSLAIPPGRHWIRVEITLEGTAGYKSYSVALQTLKGDTIYTQDGLSAAKTNSGERAVILMLPSQLVAQGEYKITLRGMTTQGPETIGEYLFRVKKP